MCEYNYSIEEVEEMLEEIAESIPKALYKNLHGGIVLIEGAKIHTKSIEPSKLYIAGEYIRNRNTGNHIKIYYGSVMKLYQNWSKEKLKEELGKILIHEFRHHIEYEAGDYSLVVEDKIFINNYLERHSE
ncbi:metallopeptidase family protein [Miniphocaeibacter massiliensis]|uniref:metallopeptidase family protein n=1 Tax=Miniphocaeibacter massiliensis TaxID=2041841 RepID=UPI000C0838C7|nr:metallopeptidase family protein [Miniphocaeibacter massiliensis]